MEYFDYKQNAPFSRKLNAEDAVYVINSIVEHWDYRQLQVGKYFSAFECPVEDCKARLRTANHGLNVTIFQAPGHNHPSRPYHGIAQSQADEREDTHERALGGELTPTAGQTEDQDKLVTMKPRGRLAPAPCSGSGLDKETGNRALSPTDCNDSGKHREEQQPLLLPTASLPVAPKPAVSTDVGEAPICPAAKATMATTPQHGVQVNEEPPPLWHKQQHPRQEQPHPSATLAQQGAHKGVPSGPGGFLPPQPSPDPGFTVRIRVSRRMFSKAFLLLHPTFLHDTGLLSAGPPASAAAAPSLPFTVSLELQEGRKDVNEAQGGAKVQSPPTFHATLSCTAAGNPREETGAAGASSGFKAVCKLLGMRDWMARYGVKEGDMVALSFQPPRTFAIFSPSEAAKLATPPCSSAPAPAKQEQKQQQQQHEQQTAERAAHGPADSVVPNPHSLPPSLPPAPPAPSPARTAPDEDPDSTSGSSPEPAEVLGRYEITEGMLAKLRKGKLRLKLRAQVAVAVFSATGASKQGGRLEVPLLVRAPGSGGGAEGDLLPQTARAVHYPDPPPGKSYIEGLEPWLLGCDVCLRDAVVLSHVRGGDRPYVVDIILSAAHPLGSAGRAAVRRKRQLPTAPVGPGQARMAHCGDDATRAPKRPRNSAGTQGGAAMAAPAAAAMPAARVDAPLREQAQPDTEAPGKARGSAAAAAAAAGAMRGAASPVAVGSLGPLRFDDRFGKALASTDLDMRCRIRATVGMLGEGGVFAGMPVDKPVAIAITELGTGIRWQGFTSPYAGTFRLMALPGLSASVGDVMLFHRLTEGVAPGRFEFQLRVLRNGPDQQQATPAQPPGSRADQPAVTERPQGREVPPLPPPRPRGRTPAADRPPRPRLSLQDKANGGPVLPQAPSNNELVTASGRPVVEAGPSAEVAATKVAPLLAAAACPNTAAVAVTDPPADPPSRVPSVASGRLSAAEAPPVSSPSQCRATAAGSFNPPVNTALELPASSLTAAHLHGYVPPGVSLPQLQPGELRICGLTFHPDVAPLVRHGMEQWERNVRAAASRGVFSGGGVDLSTWNPAAVQIHIHGVDLPTSPSAAPTLCAPHGGSSCNMLVASAFKRYGLRRTILANRLARCLGLAACWDAPLPESLPLLPDLVAPGADPGRGGLGLFAVGSIKNSWVLGVMGGYVMLQPAGRMFLASGVWRNEGVKTEMLRRVGGCPNKVSNAWEVLAKSFRLPLPGLRWPEAVEGLPGAVNVPTEADGAVQPELQMMGYGNEGALVNDPRVMPPGWVSSGPAHVKQEGGGAPEAAWNQQQIEPNCLVLPISVRGLVLPVLVAVRDIAPGEQLLRDYGADWWQQLAEAWEVMEDDGLTAEQVLWGPPLTVPGAVQSEPQVPQPPPLAPSQPVPAPVQQLTAPGATVPLGEDWRELEKRPCEEQAAEEGREPIEPNWEGLMHQAMQAAQFGRAMPDVQPQEGPEREVPWGRRKPNQEVQRQGVMQLEGPQEPVEKPRGGAEEPSAAGALASHGELPEGDQLRRKRSWPGSADLSVTAPDKSIAHSVARRTEPSALQHQEQRCNHGRGRAPDGGRNRSSDGRRSRSRSRSRTRRGRSRSRSRKRSYSPRSRSRGLGGSRSRSRSRSCDGRRSGRGAGWREGWSRRCSPSPSPSRRGKWRSGRSRSPRADRYRENDGPSERRSPHNEQDQSSKSLLPPYDPSRGLSSASALAPKGCRPGFAPSRPPGCWARPRMRYVPQPGEPGNQQGGPQQPSGPLPFEHSVVMHRAEPRALPTGRNQVPPQPLVNSSKANRTFDDGLADDDRSFGPPRGPAYWGPSGSAAQRLALGAEPHCMGPRAGAQMVADYCSTAGAPGDGPFGISAKEPSREGVVPVTGPTDWDPKHGKSLTTADVSLGRLVPTPAMCGPGGVFEELAAARYNGPLELWAECEDERQDGARLYRADAATTNGFRLRGMSVLYEALRPKGSDVLLLQGTPSDGGPGAGDGQSDRGGNSGGAVLDTAFQVRLLRGAGGTAAAAAGDIKSPKAAEAGTACVALSCGTGVPG